MKRKNGFALIEVLLAGLILAMTVLGVASVCIMSFGQLGRSAQHSSSLALGKQRIEWLRNQDYTGTALSSGVRTEFLTGDYEGFTRVTKVLVDTPRAGMKTVSVSTTAPGGMTTQISTFIAEP